MPEFGFPAQPRQASIRSMVAEIRARADDARTEAVTERFADLTAELDGRGNEVMQIEKSIQDLQEYAEAIALSEGRATTMQGALDAMRLTAQQITDTADTLRTNGTSRDFESLSEQARAALESLIGSMNVSFAGRSLFAGDAVDTAPIVDADTILTNAEPLLAGGATPLTAYAALDTAFFAAGDLFETTFYVGGTGDAPVTEVAPGERVDYGVRADEDPMRRVLFNMTVMAAAFDTTNGIAGNVREGLLELASSGLRNSIGEIAQIQGRLGSAEARIATMKSRNIASEASLTISFNELAGADSFTAALQLTQLEDQLEVAFTTTARLANLTLANFR